MKGDDKMTFSIGKYKAAIIVLSVLLAIALTALAITLISIKNRDSEKGNSVVTDNVIGKELKEGESRKGYILAEKFSEEGSAVFINSETEAQPEVDSFDTQQELENAEQGASLVLYDGNASDNKSFKVKNMLPGDSESQYYSVKVRHKGELKLYFTAKVKEETRNFGEALVIKVTHIESSNIVYEGIISDMSEEGYSVTLPDPGSEDSIASYKIEVILPGSTGNEYQRASALVDFEWFVKDVGQLLPPQTGDDPDIIIAAVMALLAFVFMIVLIVFRRRGRKDEYANEA